jgi:hypothetical protein
MNMARRRSIAGHRAVLMTRSLMRARGGMVLMLARYMLHRLGLTRRRMRDGRRSASLPHATVGGEDESKRKDTQPVDQTMAHPKSLRQGTRSDKGGGAGTRDRLQASCGTAA